MYFETSAPPTHSLISIYLAPLTSLYIMLNNVIYLPGDSVLISDVGPERAACAPGSSLICVTTNVNTDC